MTYCDKYLKDGELESGTGIIKYTYYTLQLIQQYTVSLLTTNRIIKQIRHWAPQEQDYDGLLKLMMNRIFQGKIPIYFIVSGDILDGGLLTPCRYRAITRFLIAWSIAAGMI